MHALNAGFSACCGRSSKAADTFNLSAILLALAFGAFLIVGNAQAQETVPADAPQDAQTEAVAQTAEPPGDAAALAGEAVATDADNNGVADVIQEETRSE